MSGQKVSQWMFMAVKEKLDYHKLSSSFPIEVTPLLHQLLNRIDQNNHHDHRPTLKQQSETVSAALKHEMGQLLKQNNKLHMDLMCAREQIQSMTHQFHKLRANSHSSGEELQRYSQVKKRREEELQNQLKEVKYKYNQLMDLMHEDPNKDRQYIKRLIKYKQINEKQEESVPLQCQERTQEESSQRVKQLEQKVKNREIEIMRLQRKMQYDGSDMNKIIKSFQDAQVKKRLNSADNHIQYLQDSYKRVQKENQEMRGKRGTKEALRKQVEKCHKLIEELKRENGLLRRGEKEQNFDVKKGNQEKERAVSRMKGEKEKAEYELKSITQQKNELMAKIGFLTKELNESKNEFVNAKQLLQSKQQELEERERKNEEVKLYYEYELQTFKKKLIQVQMQSEEMRGKLKHSVRERDVLLKQNQLKTESINNLEKIVTQLMQTQHQDHGRSINQNQKYVREVYILQNQLLERSKELDVALKQIEGLREEIKVEKNNSRRAELQLTSIIEEERSGVETLKTENQRLKDSENVLKAQIKNTEVSISEQQGVFEGIKLRLLEKQEKVRKLQQLFQDSVNRGKQLSQQLAQANQNNHKLTQQLSRTSKTCEQLKKETGQFRDSTFRKYEASIGDNMREVAELNRELLRAREEQERLAMRADETTCYANALREEKEYMEVEKIKYQRQSQHLKLRVAELQAIERALIIQNQNLRTIAHRI